MGAKAKAKAAVALTWLLIHEPFDIGGKLTPSCRLPATAVHICHLSSPCLLLLAPKLYSAHVGFVSCVGIIASSFAVWARIILLHFKSTTTNSTTNTRPFRGATKPSSQPISLPLAYRNSLIGRLFPVSHWIVKGYRFCAIGWGCWSLSLSWKRLEDFKTCASSQFFAFLWRASWQAWRSEASKSKTIHGQRSWDNVWTLCNKRILATSFKVSVCLSFFLPAFLQTRWWLLNSLIQYTNDWPRIWLMNRGVLIENFSRNWEAEQRDFCS